MARWHFLEAHGHSTNRRERRRRVCRTGCRETGPRHGGRPPRGAHTRLTPDVASFSFRCARSRAWSGLGGHAVDEAGLTGDGGGRRTAAPGGVCSPRPWPEIWVGADRGRGKPGHKIDGGGRCARVDSAWAVPSGGQRGKS